MDDSGLERALREIGNERHVPGPALVWRTKARLRGRRLIQVASVLSLATQLAFFAVVIWALAAAEVEAPAKIAGFAALFAYVGCVAVALVAAREQVRRFFRRVEGLTRQG